MCDNLPKNTVDTAKTPDTLGEQGAITGWIDDTLLSETQRVWSKQYGRDVSAAEATEILLDVSVHDRRCGPQAAKLRRLRPTARYSGRGMLQ